MAASVFLVCVVERVLGAAVMVNHARCCVAAEVTSAAAELMAHMQQQGCMDDLSEHQRLLWSPRSWRHTHQVHWV